MALISHCAHVAPQRRSLLRCRREENIMAEEIDATRGGHCIKTTKISEILCAVVSGAALTLTRHGTERS